MNRTMHEIVSDTQDCKKPVFDAVAVSAAHLAECKDLTDAYRLSLQVSGKEPKQVAFEIGMSAGDLSRVLRQWVEGADRRYMPHDKIVPFMVGCGNSIPLQWLMLQWQALTGVMPVPGGELRTWQALGLDERFSGIESRLTEIFEAVRKPVGAYSLAPSVDRPVALLLKISQAEMEVAGYER